MKSILLKKVQVQCLKRELVLKDQLLHEKDYSISLQTTLIASYDKECNNPSSVCSRQEVNIDNGQGQKGHPHLQVPNSSGAIATDTSSLLLSSRRGNIGNPSNITYASAADYLSDWQNYRINVFSAVRFSTWKVSHVSFVGAIFCHYETTFLETVFRKIWSWRPNSAAGRVEMEESLSGNVDS